MNAPTPFGARQDARPENIVSAYADILRSTGYVIIPDLLDTKAIGSIDLELAERFKNTPFCEGPFYGTRTKRFGRLLSRSARTRSLVQHDLILAIVNDLLQPWCDVIQLNLTQAVEVHPGSPEQVPHRDQDMWQGPKGEVEYLVNVMWPTTPYTQETGATMVWPGSHEHQQDMILPSGDVLHAEMQPGSALIYLGSTLHGAGRNSSQTIRRGMIVSYCLGWLKPYENQWLAYPPKVARSFPPELAALVGYRQHRPNLGNFEGQCPSILLQDNVPEHLHAVDALRPDQIDLIAAYRGADGLLPSTAEA